MDHGALESYWIIRRERPRREHPPECAEGRACHGRGSAVPPRAGDIDAARALVDEAKGAELFLYPGDQHYFADSSLPSYDPDATALLTQRVLDFLRTH